MKIPDYFMGRPAEDALKMVLDKLEQKDEKKEEQVISGLEGICRGYEKFMGWRDHGTIGMIPTSITDKYKPRAKQIEEFSRQLIKYKHLKYFISDTANYLTALMHSSPDEEFTLDLRELSKEGIKLKYLGFILEKKNLTIEGDAGDYVGEWAKNCPITVNGNAGDSVGNFATGCKIRIKGSYGSLSDYIGKGTEIYQWKNKWKKIWPKKQR